MKSNDLKLKSFDSLFGSAESMTEPVEIALDQLQAFPQHPFTVDENPAMEELIESIRNHGVLEPGVCRPLENGHYEIVAGHCRAYASAQAGKKTMPFFIREMDDKEATDYMVDSNIRGREIIKISEKAWAYRMKLEVSRHQGRVSDMGSAADAGTAYGDSERTVQRYVRLTYLLPDLLVMIDDGQLAVGHGVTLSYLNKIEQGWVLDQLQKGAKMTSDIADRLKQLAAVYRNIESTLTEEDIKGVMGYEREEVTDNDILAFYNYGDFALISTDDITTENIKMSYNYCGIEHEGISIQGSNRGATINDKKEITWNNLAKRIRKIHEDEQELHTPNEEKQKTVTKEPDLSPEAEITPINPLDVGSCITGTSESGRCGAAAYCSEEYTCCAQCDLDCNGRCGWLNELSNYDVTDVQKLLDKKMEEHHLVTDNSPESILDQHIIIDALRLLQKKLLKEEVRGEEL